jgi:UDP-2,3-diacylglucosamine pyrophosphatase LpxH
MLNTTTNQLLEPTFKPTDRVTNVRIKHPRSIFVSDVHLGCKYGKTVEFLEFLNRYQPEYLYLVGDILDGWRLARNWYWVDSYSQIIHRLNQLADSGTKIFYTPGNHDDFLRRFLSVTSLFGKVQVADQFVHTTADDRQLVIIHGDQFDRVVSKHRAISGLGDRAYDASMLLNRWFNRVWCPLGGDPIYASKYLKQQVKRLTNRLSNFEDTVINYAKSLGCSGIVCGHIHRPDIKIDSSGIVYYNTGDWVENTSAIIESEDGQLAMINSPFLP